MSEIKALDRLRTAARNMVKGRNLENHEECNLFLIIADEIEAEIADRYMLVPVDADDAPIHVGDEVEWLDGNGVYKVCGIGTLVVLRTHESYCFTIDPKCLRIIKPRTLEDVLAEFGIAAARELNADPDGYGISDKTIAKCVSEIRDLLGGDE